MNGAARWTGHFALGLALVAAATPLSAQGRRGGGTPATPGDQTVPKDLRPLLAPRRSEMRLVVLRYNADRAVLSPNYAGETGGGGRGGRGGRGGDSANTPIPVSVARIARLKRFDMSWQAAIEHLDATRLTPAARADRDTLAATIRRNLAQLDADVATLGELAPLIPFESDIVALVEARNRIEEVDGERAAAAIVKITRDIGAMRAQLDSTGSGAGIHASTIQATRAAQAVETLRSNLNSWFIFYDGYDPLFTWWADLPYKKADSTLQAYATFLRAKVAAANELPLAAHAAPPIAAAPVPTLNEVPDLNEIIALPQDEMADIVARFVQRGNGGRGGGNGGGNGGRGAGAPPGQVRDSTFYKGWLAALRTLDFDRLTRNAQVDYLYLKKVAEIQIARLGVPLPPNPPRQTDNSGVPGAARGREGLIRDLQDELIPYTPEQLIALAEKEFAWCDQEMLKASREMGFGDDWKKALEKTKTMHVPPGKQAYMVRDLITQSITYLRAHDLVTVPEIDAETQRMIMMTPERQLVNPFFLGGGQMSVSYPTNTMDFDAREQSMRGNNEPWSHATAFHETVPGHNLVGFIGQRFTGYRASLGNSGPFFGEGWPVYWELTLYEKGYDTTPEERVGALFWRMHRCARIIFSLKFHMGEWSPQQAIDFLIDRVGHEPDNARGEVLRSFQGGYSPLYQAGYLLGALQFRGLRREMVDSKQMTEKVFHDEILRQGSMPVALIRLALTQQKLTRDMSIDWKFYGDLPEH